MVTIASTSISNWVDATSVELWIVADRAFIASDGTPVLSGKNSPRAVVKKVTCSVSGGVLTIPSFTLQPTTDGNPADAKYLAGFYTPAGKEIRRFDPVDGFRLPTTTPTTWADIRAYNFGRALAENFSAYTKDEVLALLAATRPYKVYTAIVSQSGTGAPTATVLENTLGSTPVWSRYSGTSPAGAGRYYLTLSGAFPDANKIWAEYSYSDDIVVGDTTLGMYRRAITYNASDSLLLSNLFHNFSTQLMQYVDGIVTLNLEIRVYR